MPSFFFSSGNAPDAKVILNRNTQFQYDITADVVDAGTNNSVGDMFGSFTVVLDNTNDKHVDRYGNVDIDVMSSIEIFVKSAIANQNEIPGGINPSSILTPEGQSINSLIDNQYGLTAISANNASTSQQQKAKYLADFAQLNNGVFLQFSNYSSTTIIAKQGVSSYADFQLAPGQALKMPPQLAQYKRIFLGVVETVQQSFSSGSPMTITLTGESIGYWLKASMVNIAPSLSEPGQSTSTSSDPTIYSNKYADTSAIDIFRDLIKGSSNSTLAVSNFSFGNNQNSYENLNSQDYLSQNIVDNLNESYVDGSGQALTLQQAFANAQPAISVDNTAASVLNGLDLLQTSVTNGTLLDGTNVADLDASGQDTTTQANVSSAQTTTSNYSSAVANYNKINTQCSADIAQQNINIQNAQNDTASNAASRTATINKAYAQITQDNNQISVAKAQMDAAQAESLNNPIIQSEINAINTIRNQIQANIRDSSNTGRKILTQLGIMKHWEQIFSQIILEVADATFLQKTFPFKEVLRSPDIMDGDYQPKSTIAQQIAQGLNFEFYVDTNGHFVLKPPMYNIGIPNDDPTYVIKQEDIQSWNINDTVDGIITRVGVTGDWHGPAQLERIQTYNIHTDLNLVNKYGVHDIELNNLIFLKDPIACANYGQSYMAQNNQKLKTASVTIMGRPDIRLGVACYLLPRDTVYYITSISHNFTVGQQYTTTLTLVGGRKIVTGYAVKSSIQTLTRSTVGGITVRSTVDNQDGTISHWVLTNSLSAPTLAVLASSSPETQKYFVVKNSYIITSHPNIGYIGLIVPQGSAILNDINYNVFRYLFGAINVVNQKTSNADYSVSNPSSSLTPTIQWIQSQFGNNTAPFDYIMSSLIDFIWNNQLGASIIGTRSYPQTKDALKNALVSAASPSNSGTPNDYNIKLFEAIANSFTQSVLNDYIGLFLNTISTNSQIAQTNGVSQDVQLWSATGSYFNQMINDISQTGSYSAYTDGDGREYPVLIDYGQSFNIDNSQISINTNTASQQSTNTQNETDAHAQAIISAAQLFLAGSAPNSSQATIQQNNTVAG